MRHRPTTLIAALVLAAACSGSPATEDDPQTVQMRDQAVRVIEQEEREEAVRRPPDEEVQEPAEELEVEMFELALNQPVRSEGGLEVRLVDGGPNWTVEFDHHGRKAKATHQGTPLYLEGVAFGHLYVLTQFQNAVQLTLRSDAPPEPLTAEAAFELARRERAARLGCEGASEGTEVADNGTVVLRMLDAGGKETCRIVIGRFTRTVVEE